MARFHDCILSAVQQKEISEEQGDVLIARYEEVFSARRQAGDNRPEDRAREAIAAHLDEQSARKKALAALAETKRDDIKQYVETFRDQNNKPNVFEAVMNLLENFGGGAGVSSIRNRSRAIAGLAEAQMADALSAFRRSGLTGRRFNKPMLENVVRESLGESTGSPEAKAMAGAIQDAIETLRQRYNEVGGNIGKIEGGYLPQYHNPSAVLTAGLKGWMEYIKPKLDLARMRDPLTDGPLSPQRLDEVLKTSYEHIVTGGWSDREPQARAIGIGAALANQRQEHRFLHFKSADDWLAYNADFGRGQDPMAIIAHHINGMSKDIAAMEVLGPNPNATIEWLKQVISSEEAKKTLGKDSLFTTKIYNAKTANHRIDSLYSYVRGRETLSKGVATFFGNVRNVLSSAQLGGTGILAASTDPFIDASARYLSGLPVSKALYGIAYTFSKATREEAIRAGMGLDDFLHVAGDEARFSGVPGGSEATRWLADRVVNLNGLNALTQSRRHLFGLDFMGFVADSADKKFADLKPYLRRTFEDYGLKEKDWDKLRAVEAFKPSPDSAGILRAADVAKSDRKLAERYLEMIEGQLERANPTGTGRSRSAFVGTQPKGSIWAELVESGLQYKSFGLSFTTLQWDALRRELATNPKAGAAYGASLAFVLTMGGALAIQLKNIVAGRDMQPMDNSNQGYKFWLSAMQYGGGFGVMGDFLFSDATRFGKLASVVGGPTGGLISDAIQGPTGVVGNVQKGLTGQKTHVARDLVNFAGRYTPLLSSLPYTRMPYRRMFLDQLQYLTDPDAHKNWREQQNRMRRETNQGYFWRPGEMTPERSPVFLNPSTR